MAKIKLTKNELKKQKDALKMYKRYLPTLQLKKQQLQTEIRGIEAKAKARAEERERLLAEFRAWIAVFGEEDAIRTESGDWLLSVREIRTTAGNIAGVEIPVYAGADFVLADYDLYLRPLWIDKALDRLKAMLELDLEIKVLQEQIARLARELRITTQRVNLFEKVKIPETAENIKRIRIYLGDQQTAQVVRGKIAKRKVVRAAS
ncbi:MAG TPA: V-type ATP synthase subunit D [Spirochaetia bacterium]|jgi:V/A-type H+-transporting ATPase subunit D|nr:V-type ATP synthase subunit D [Spirochaetales bacterium]HRY80157.1 V-type ATP synthase subunit D [Spirochaetia bacterium]HRZ88705.1 V-type ATP synthase subunit D [Spirochaetia bacterium]